MDLITKVKNIIRSQHLVKRGDKIIVAVSGGPDSVTLLNILNTLKHELGIQLFVAHLNHRLRKSATQDQQFVKKICYELNLPFLTKIAHISKRGGSVEEEAREARFSFLIEVARKCKADTIALGHTEDDLAETVLMRILRGTGLLGMRALLPKRDIKGFAFIRPLLYSTREEIEAFLKKRQIRFRRDPTNNSTRFFRNKIRLRLLPLLEEEYKGNIKEVLVNLSRNTTIDYDYLEKEGQRKFKQLVKQERGASRILVELKRLLKLHPAVRRILIRLAIEKLKGDTRRLTLKHLDHIEDLIHHRPKYSLIHLPNHLVATKTPRCLCLYTRNS
jgi:tRNA(Ile)-lysidine synthase